MSAASPPEPGSRRAIAIDLGGTKTSVAVVDAAGQIFSRAKRPSRENGRALPFEAVIALAAETAQRAGSELLDLTAVGVVVPGIYKTATGMAWAPNLWGWDEVPLRDALQSRVPVPVRIDSDRSGYVLGEQWLGAARGCTDAVFLAVGTGIGAGIIAGGRLVRGSGGIAGAVGWFAVDPRFRPAYAKVGCLEVEAAGPGLADRAARLIARGRPSRLASIGGGPVQALTAELVAEAARAGDAVAGEAVHETAEYLGMGVANLISALNPQIVVLGGGLMKAGDLLLEPVRAGARRWAQPLAFDQVRIEPTQLGDDAGLLGAARLALFDDA
jgi:glucokinase